MSPGTPPVTIQTRPSTRPRPRPPAAQVAISTRVTPSDGGPESDERDILYFLVDILGGAGVGSRRVRHGCLERGSSMKASSGVARSPRRRVIPNRLDPPTSTFRPVHTSCRGVGQCVPTPGISTRAWESRYRGERTASDEYYNDSLPIRSSKSSSASGRGALRLAPLNVHSRRSLGSRGRPGDLWEPRDVGRTGG